MCKDAFSEYKGKNHCGYNIARSISDAKQFLQKNVSEDHEKWKWINLHTMEYINLPWSRTPLKFIFHKSVPVAGNTNTPNVAKVSFPANKDSVVIKSSHAANYK